MHLIVLDTNALIQSLPSRSQYHRIWTDFLIGHQTQLVRRMIDDVFAGKKIKIKRI